MYCNWQSRLVLGRRPSGRITRSLVNFLCTRLFPTRLTNPHNSPLSWRVGKVSREVAAPKDIHYTPQETRGKAGRHYYSLAANGHRERGWANSSRATWLLADCLGFLQNPGESVKLQSFCVGLRRGKTFLHFQWNKPRKPLQGHPGSFSSSSSASHGLFHRGGWLGPI